MLYDNTLDVQFRKTCLLVCRLIFRFRDGVVTARPSVRSDPPWKRGAAKQERALAQALVHEELDDGGRGCWLSGRGAGAHSSVLLVADAAKLANEPLDVFGLGQSSAMEDHVRGLWYRLEAAGADGQRLS